MMFLLLTLSVGLLVGALVFRADVLRRAVSRAKLRRLPVLLLFDLMFPAGLAGAGAMSMVAAARSGVVSLFSPLSWGGAAALGIAFFVWKEGLRQVQFQRPTGIVSGEALVLAGLYMVIQSVVFRSSPHMPKTAASLGIAAAAIAAGGTLIGVIVPPFVKGYEGHRIIEQLPEQDQAVQAEYVPATPECPYPERWRMVDSQTSELEILEFLKSVVTTVKPSLIVETGTFIGHSAIKMAEGLCENGFGRIITVEYDPAIFAKARERIDASPVRKWIEYRNASSLDTTIDGTIDIFFSDSHLPIRESEIRKFLPQISPYGLILVHDASSHFKVVRESILKLEAEGLISAVLLPTPRGMVVAQKREGRR